MSEETVAELRARFEKEFDWIAELLEVGCGAEFLTIWQAFCVGAGFPRDTEYKEE